MPLNRKATVAQIVAEHAETARVFQKNAIGCFRRSAATVPKACREHRLDPEEVFAQLEEAISAAARRGDPRDLPDATLVEHIVEHHHSYARRALPYIVALLAKVAGSNGKRNAKLSALCDAGQELAEALEAHFDAEERSLFPALLTHGARREDLRGELEGMFRHHREVELLLARMRWLADGYTVPAWGGRSYQTLMEELEALEEDVMQHILLEDCVVVPRLTCHQEAA